MSACAWLRYACHLHHQSVLQHLHLALLERAGPDHFLGRHDVHVQRLDHFPQKVRDGFLAHDLHEHRVGRHDSQDLVHAYLGLFLCHQDVDATGNNSHVALQLLVLGVAHVVVVQPVDQLLRHAHVDVADHLLDRLAGVAHEHRHARGRTSGPTRRGVARHVPRHA